MTETAQSAAAQRRPVSALGVLGELLLTAGDAIYGQTADGYYSHRFRDSPPEELAPIIAAQAQG